MKDFLVVKAKTALKVTSLSPIRGFLPPAIVVLGVRLNLANEVIYNGITVGEFVIVGPSRLIVRIPPSQVGVPLRELQVFTSASVSHQDALVTLGLPTPLQTVQGIDRLVQEFVLAFFTTPGSDLFNPLSGGGGAAMVGKSSGPSATAGLALAVDRVRQQILKAQANVSSIPTSERLLSATLSSTQFNPVTTTLSGVVDLRSVAGDSALVTVR